VTGEGLVTNPPRGYWSAISSALTIRRFP